MKKCIFLSLFTVLILASCGTPVPTGKYSALAQCLIEKGVKVYGAFWCPNCAKQKELFGDARDLIPYVECDPRGENEQSALCLEKKIEKYPTWIFQDGSEEVGVTEPEEIAARAGCSVPIDETKNSQ